MSKHVELSVLADKEGRILAAAGPGDSSEDGPSLLGLQPMDGERVFSVEVPVEQASDEVFLARLRTDFQIDLAAPMKTRAQLRSLRGDQFQSAE